MNKTFHLPATAAALAVLLSACGGGDGSAPAGTSSTKGPDTTVAASAEARFGDATLMTQEAAVGKAVTDSRPISGQHGVRGDVLLTMLDQKPCNDPVQSSSYNGTPVPDGQRVLPRLEAEQMLDPFNYQQLGPSIHSRFIFQVKGVCDTQYFRYQPAQPGSYSLSVYSSPYFRGPTYDPQIEERFKKAELKVPLTVTTDATTVGSVVKSGDKVDLSSTREFGFRHDAQVSWGVLQHWQNGSDQLKMLLLPGARDGEARLCWNPDSSTVKRLHCMSWRAPQGWTRGQPLELVDQYLVDDRSVYPGEQGFLYARSF